MRYSHKCSWKFEADVTPRLPYCVDFSGTLCTEDEFLISGDHITPALIKMKLKFVLGYDSDTIKTLFNYRDHQNVPNAIKLLGALHKLAISLGFLDDMENQGLVILGQLIGFLIMPYINIFMCLFDQLASLSAAGHLLFALYWQNHTDFCPGQFFYDLQTFVKNVFWSVAKQKVLGPNSSCFIIQNGSDQLKGSFGIYRTMDHAHNVDILQLSHCASQAAEVLQILANNPELDRGHQCLALSGAEDIDHTNPKLWTGDVCVSNVSLLTAWTNS